MRDFGYHLAACQGFSKSRREGTLIAMTKEDMWCPEGVIGYGLAEPPDYFLEGHQRFPQSAESLEAGSVWVREFPRFGVGEYVGIMAAPLATANFEPDLLVIYCNSAQLRCLLAGMKYSTGYVVTSRFETNGACVQCTVPVLQSGECQVTVPCGGDRKRALAQDDELIFSLPTVRLEELMIGLRHFDETGSGYTQFAPDMRPEYPLPELYMKVAKMIGMDLHEE